MLTPLNSTEPGAVKEFQLWRGSTATISRQPSYKEITRGSLQHPSRHARGGVAPVTTEAGSTKKKSRSCGAGSRRRQVLAQSVDCVGIFGGGASSRSFESRRASYTFKPTSPKGITPTGQGDPPMRSRGPWIARLLWIPAKLGKVPSFLIFFNCSVVFRRSASVAGVRTSGKGVQEGWVGE